MSKLKVQYILQELTYSERNYGFPEGKIEAAEVGWRHWPFSLPQTAFDGHVLNSHPRNDNSNLSNSSELYNVELWSSLVCYLLNCP